MLCPVILFEDFSFTYRTQSEPTLHNIDLEIFPGEKILIAGPSGSGKSTLAHCVNGLIPFNYKGKCEGRLLVDGRETKDLGVFELSKTVGTVLQDTDGQFVGLTAGEDIAFSLENNAVPQTEMRKRVRDAANLTGIGDALFASPFDLSGGQKQRVSMAGIIVDDVKVLLFDEPLANLDPATGKTAVELIDKVMAETETTVIIIEHRIEDALHRAVSRVILMDGGRIVADASAGELLCGGSLPRYGLREPLYAAAMKYAGIKIEPRHKPERVETLTLSDIEKEKILIWNFGEISKPEPVTRGELLRVSGLSFNYDENLPEALNDVNFSVARGEMTAIVGTNGAGKSTLAKLICGFEKPDAGRIFFGGNDITDYSIPKRAEHIGYVMQNPNQMICKPMIFDEVAFGVKNRNVTEGDCRENVEAVLEICGLRPFRKWPVSALSYGQKKRVTIASVLVLEPDIIILDEPTAGQDYRHYTEFMEFLRSLNERGTTVLMITHDMHLMLEYAPRALVLSDGKLIADLNSAELLCDLNLTKEASLKETSLFHLAALCGINDPAGFTKRFIKYDRARRSEWR